MLTNQPKHGDFELAWRRPTKLMTLEADQLHIWRVPLEFSLAEVNKLTVFLSSDEIDRADRFHFESDRNHFIVARAWLRIISGSYLKVEPARLKFDYSSHGKPSLAKPFSEIQLLNFNLAHSGKLALYGMTLGRKIGIDLERITYQLDYEELARRFFSQNEVARLSALPPATRRRAFFNCWTRKEAFVKAKGLGLSLALDQFDVALGAEHPALLRTRWDPHEAACWSVRGLDVDPDYVAAIAVEGAAEQLSFWHVDECVFSQFFSKDDELRPGQAEATQPS